ncbi:lysophospholipid acyltransferase family protein [Alteromonas flava]|uniref:lysophospholipid acyltransferase family protein n=1 Tax=Alteromonas flava TaxID=2048003 RepID=UPI000C2910FE|nr:GNAT family N-acyltransferase [Alteromonas flava]
MQRTDISLRSLTDTSSFFTRAALAVLDRLLGVAKMNRLYQHHQMQGLSREEFADKLIQILDLQVEGLTTLQERIPRTGPVVIASNHPFGGIEGVVLARAIAQVRPELKVLANQGLKIFPELQSFFIFTNPLAERDPRNGPSLRQCKQHIQQGNALLLFPAGKVSFSDRQRGRIREHPWNRLVARLAQTSSCQYVPIFVSGQNSPFFYSVERLYHRLRMFLLGHELLNKQGQTISIGSGYPVPAKLVSTAVQCRALSYAQQTTWQQEWPPNRYTESKPLAPKVDANLISKELLELPSEQLLATHNQFEIYYAYQAQVPHLVTEIARLREMVFRQLNEGSGEPIDTDYFDSTYTHLFVFDRDTKAIIGAYRMGQTDRLLAQGDLEQLYLNRMFNFAPTFVNQLQPCLELGRSFLVPHMQRSRLGLFLLWRGIGAFVARHPQYRTLYGTVSVSKLYDPRSVKLIEQAYAQNSSSVKPRAFFPMPEQPELSEEYTQKELQTLLPSFLVSLEADGKSIPVLMKQYLKLGATFHCLGIDKNFNDTPGFLLSVELPKAPEKQLQLFLGDKWRSYVDYVSR